MNREEQLALLIDLENFFWERTTEFVKVNLQRIGRTLKRDFWNFAYITRTESNSYLWV